MLNAFRLWVSNPGWLHFNCRCIAPAETSGHHANLRFLPSNHRRFASFTVQSVDSTPSQPSFSSARSSAAIQPSQLNFTHRRIQFLSFMACAVAISATWLFCSAIPALLAFKRAAESMEKLMDTTREELPSTMAAVRLSGMEISDLTMELSDLGQEITQGVRSSTRAVRVAEERLRRLTTANPIGGGLNRKPNNRASSS